MATGMELKRQPTVLPVDADDRDDGDEIATPVDWYRGGTSKVFFVDSDEISWMDPDQRSTWILSMFGSPDKRQIDGIGGADQVTSKFAILGQPTRPDADIDYSFFQVGIDSDIIATDLNCGNVSAAVALYAVDKGIVTGKDGMLEVRIHNTNDGKIFYAGIELRNGKAVQTGSFVCEGVPGTGAPISLDFRDAVGGRTGKLLPTGHSRDRFSVPGYGEMDVTVVDIANLIAFVPATAFGLQGNEDPVAMQAMPGLVEAVEWLRGAVAQRLGLADTPTDARRQSPGTPFVSLLSAPQDWSTFGYGVARQAAECDIMGRGFTVQAFTKAYWGTGSVCTGVAAAIPGTVVNDLLRNGAAETGKIRIAHPSGTLQVEIDLSPGEDGFQIRKAALLRTARRLMAGTVFVPRNRVVMETRGPSVRES